MVVNTCQKMCLSVNISSMNSQKGAINILLVPFIFTVILFFGAAGFGGWAYMSRQDYKDNSDQKSRAAVAVAVEKTKSDKDNEFLEREKEPTRTFSGPEALGSVTFKYPKTWSVYYEAKNNSLNLLAHPKYVPADPSTTYALKVEVVDQAYAQIVKTYEGNVKSGKLKSRAYKLPNQSKILGIRLDGEVDRGKQGSTVVIPLRDKTIKISTQDKQFLKDFDKTILSSFNFVP